METALKEKIANYGVCKNLISGSQEAVYKMVKHDVTKRRVIGA